MPALPDLRFEKTYIKSIRPYMHTEISGAYRTGELEKRGHADAVELVRLDWGRVLWITVRDQVLSPFAQGAVWGLATVYLLPTLGSFRRSFTAWWKRGEASGMRSGRADGDGVGALRSWVSGFTTANTKSNVAPSRHAL